MYTFAPMKTHKKHIGRVVKQAREAQGLSLWRVAKDADLQIAQVRSIEEGSTAYTFDSLVAACSVLGIVIDLSWKPRPSKAAGPSDETLG